MTKALIYLNPEAMEVHAYAESTHTVSELVDAKDIESPLLGLMTLINEGFEILWDKSVGEGRLICLEKPEEIPEDPEAMTTMTTKVSNAADAQAPWVIDGWEFQQSFANHSIFKKTLTVDEAHKYLPDGHPKKDAWLVAKKLEKYPNHLKDAIEPVDKDGAPTCGSCGELIPDWGAQFDCAACGQQHIP